MWNISALRAGLLALLAGLAGIIFAPRAAAGDDGLESLSLEELMNVRVSSASNVSERLADAPATVIVLSGEEIRSRGYREFSEILDDLPGMQVSRPYGDTWQKNYWRGYRNNIGDPYLILVDGLVFNHLYFNISDIMATFPLGSIERVEIVYGPASSVYGANAFMGVINVITRKAPAGNSLSGRVELAGESRTAAQGEMQLLARSGDFNFSLSARLSDGSAQPGAHQNYEYTRNRYYADPALWGGLIRDGRLGGRFHSPARQVGIDLRAGWRTLELGAQYFLLDTGYGLEFAADRVQNQASWKRPELSLFLRDRHTLGKKLTLESLVRYRESGIGRGSSFLESFPGTALAPAQTVAYSYWHSRNSSWTISQTADVKVSDRIGLNAGIKFERKDLQKAYDLSYGPALPAAAISGPDDYPFPPELPAVPVPSNRITTDNWGVYAQGRFSPAPAHQLHLGVRWDRNSQYGAYTTVRAGYAGSFGPWGLKALYGEAYQEPTPRLLYGGWTGSGSDPDLRPERSRTVELSGSYTAAKTRHLVSLYRVRNTGTIVNFPGGARNLGERNVFGADYHAQTEWSLPWIPRLSVWGYTSVLFKADEESFSPSGVRLGTIRTGDLADWQLHGGLTASWREVSLALRGRHIGARPTVASNPVREAGAYTTLDAMLRVEAPGRKGLSVSFGVYNLTDERYDHPGVRDASAGITPGYFDATGLWHGSDGYYSSLLPQPGRSARVALKFEF
jgi:outer membrane receptor protein involved in Fe transport